MKLLKDLLYGVRLKDVVGHTQIAINNVCYDSREVQENSLFVAIRGTQVDGHDFIEKAVISGAIAIVCEQIPENTTAGIQYVVTRNSAMALSAIASNWYENPSQEMTVVGITGTNGKTTVSTLLFHLFSQP